MALLEQYLDTESDFTLLNCQALRVFAMGLKGQQLSNS
jgi:hypothetical protein